MKELIKASCVKAVLGILNNLSPLPLNDEPETNSIPPLTNKEPVNCEPLSIEITLNPYSGATDAVMLPLFISVDIKASCVNAERGISNNCCPLPLMNEPDAIKMLPLNVEPLAVDCTTNPNSSVTEAVTEPLAIKLDKRASGVKAERGISNKPLPEPLNCDADTEPSKLAEVLTTKPKLGEIDAVALPLAIKVLINASGVRAERGISNKFLPEPLNDEPELIRTLPLTRKLPLISAKVLTTKPLSGDIDAVALPLAIRGATVDGTFNNCEPSPTKEPVNEPLALLTIKISLISTEPVNSCLSVSSSPNLLEPDE